MCMGKYGATYLSTHRQSAVSLIQDTLLFLPVLRLHHDTLTMHNDTHSMLLDYASYQVDLHQLEEAIEPLERGRDILWPRCVTSVPQSINFPRQTQI